MQLLRFGAVGVVGFVVDAGLTLVMTQFLHSGALPGRVVAFVIAATVTWNLNRRYTFRSEAGASSLASYIFLTAFGALINIGVYRSWIQATSTAPAQLVTGVAMGSIVALAFNFTVSRYIVFRDGLPSSKESKSMRINTQTVLLTLMCVVFAALALTGRLAPRLDPDTPTYLNPWEWPDDPLFGSIWGGTRTPLLGFMLAPFRENFSILPAMMLGLFFSATYYLYRRLIAFGASESAALAMTLPLVISNSVLRYSKDVGAEFPAIVLLVYALAEVVTLQDKNKRSLFRYVAFMLALGAAYILRPSFLPFIGIMPVLFALLSFAQKRQLEVKAAIGIFLLSLTPFFMVSSVRYHAVGDFNIVSFGGFNMTGMTSSMLSNDLIPHLKAENRELARSILGKRQALERSGEISPMAIDYDTGERSFRRTARSHFDILSFNFDELAHKVVKLTERKTDETWVNFNKRMMSFSIDVIKNSPVEYVMWVIGAVRSAVGIALAQNFPLLIGALGLASLYCFLFFRSSLPSIKWPPLDIATIAFITVFFSLGSGLLMVLVAFPANRYVSTSAMFIPAPVFYMWFRLLQASNLWRLPADQGGHSGSMR